jgi:hypothetical protein
MTHRTTTPFALGAALAATLLASAELAAQAPPPAAPKPAQDTLAVAPDSAVRDSTEVRAVARRYAGTVRNCYQEQGLKSDPALRGLLRVDLTVLPTGQVQAATATATDVSGIGMPAVTACVSTATRAWRFSGDAPRAERLTLEYDLLPPSP